MLTKAEAAKLRRAVTRYVRARIEHSWKGGGDPADIPAINAEYKAARIAYHSTIAHLTIKEAPNAR